nr:nucleoside recognition domain-containing protein [uncultured Desulfuromonas sp.]
MMRPFFSSLSLLVREAIRTCLTLFKITLPVSALTKVLTDCGATAFLGDVLGPVMQFFGLPGEMGLVWASAMMTNLYGGLSVFATLPQANSLTVAQVSVLTTMMLMAHGLPVEMLIARKAGVRLRCSLLVRCGGAIFAGAMLHGLYRWTGWLQQHNNSLWQPPQISSDWVSWGIAQSYNMLSIATVIFLLLGLMRLLEKFGLVRVLTQGIRPVLTPLGMSAAAAPVTMIGMFLGLSYGGGLIIQEAKSGHLAINEVVLSLSLMGMCHSLIEDTLLMGLVGGHWTAILVGRVVVSMAVIFALRLAIHALPLSWLQRHVYA